MKTTSAPLEFHSAAGEIFNLRPNTLAARFEGNNQLRFQDDTRYIRGITTDGVKKLNVENTSDPGHIAIITNNGTVEVTGTISLRNTLNNGSVVIDTTPKTMEVTGSISPGADSTYNLGSPSYRWANVYTGDLHLKNDRGNWTIYEEPDMLVVVNNLTGKKYKMGLTPLEDEG